MSTLVRTTVSRLTEGMSATFDPDVAPKHVVCCWSERTKNGRARGKQNAGYYVKLAGEYSGSMCAGNKRIWVLSEEIN